ncbi:MULTISPECIES: LrgB family protein [unclassified Dyella]|uniref:LrgB family protein n=1 Tax=unclassified Dyella TaxID=2634549 RepID=UPI0031B57173
MDASAGAGRPSVRRAGTAKACDIGLGEGSVACLAMVLAGLLNVLLAPAPAALLR